MQKSKHGWMMSLVWIGILSLVGCTLPSQVTISETASAANRPAVAGETTDDTTSDAVTDSTAGRPAGWGEASHSNDAEPDYDVVFPADQVNTITVTIAPTDWEAMQENMTDLLGEPGERGPGRGGFGRPGNGDGPPPAMGRGQSLAGREPVTGTVGMQPPALPDAGFGGNNSPLGGAGGAGSLISENPMWVPATIEFQEHIWTNVGVRYKGNSSLMSAWNAETLKLPLKLDFDEFEDEYPEIKNQRFYGFKQLSLANNIQDSSYMRDVITYDLLEEADLVAAQTAFYNVILDYGEGPVNLGIYTMIEVIDDTVIDRYFDDKDGNIYEGDGRGVSLAEGTFDQIATSFQKENNEDEADWRDIEQLYAVLHDDTRTTDPAVWRTELESIFDVDSFLEWLALSAVIEHWDTYGAMTHNFYLYHDPETDQLTWISWDHNLVLGASGGGPGGERPGGDQVNAPQMNRNPGAGAPGGRGGSNRNTSLDKADVGDEWPLISYLIADPVYQQAYLDELQATLDELFVPERLTAAVADYAEILAPYVAAEGNADGFAAAVEALQTRIESRYNIVEEFLAQ